VWPARRGSLRIASSALCALPAARTRCGRGHRPHLKLIEFLRVGGLRALFEGPRPTKLKRPLIRAAFQFVSPASRTRPRSIRARERLLPLPAPLVSKRFVVAASTPLSALRVSLSCFICNGEGSTAYFLADGLTAIAKASV